MFVAVDKSPTQTAGTSASPTDTSPRGLPATDLFSLVLEAENFDQCMSACGKRGIQYTERGAIEYVCNCVHKFFSIIFQYIVRNFSSLIIISIFY